MRRLVSTSLLIAILTMAAAPHLATAAPNEIKLSIGGQAEFVSSGLIRVPVSFTCPVTAGFGDISVIVFQEETGAFGDGAMTEACTGNSQTVVVNVLGGAFALGPALARGHACNLAPHCFIEDFAQRRIQIVP